MIDRVRRRITAWLTRRRGWLMWEGVRLYAPARSEIADQIIRAGAWEPHVAAVLDTAVPDGTTMFDVGANIGASVIPLLARRGTLRVVSFEPSPTILGYLTRTRDESPFRDRWEVVPKAVTERPGEVVTFTTFAGAEGGVYEGLRDTGRASGTARGTEIKVPTTSLDAEWEARGRPPVSVVKIDVEGFELGVLSGAAACLRECRPVVLTEWCRLNFPVYGHRPEAILDAAAAAGYDVYVLPELVAAVDRPVFKYQLATRGDLLLLPKP